jgi:archaemetzincin
VPSGSKPRELVLAPFDWFGGGEVLDALAARLGATFRLRVRVDPRGANLGDCFDAARGQYESGRVLARLGALSTAGWVLGVTSADLFLPVLKFVIGEACLGGPTAVVSTFRLRDGADEDVSRSESSWQRLVKEAVHELGHCSGLVHCRDGSCVMFASAVAEEVDWKGDTFCADCERLVEQARSGPAGC